MQLDKDNVLFNQAVDLVKHTRRSLFITGKAGTGKTTFLKFIREEVDKRTAVVAPTGIAAIQAGGETIHSFFHIPPSVYIPGDRRLRRKADPDDPDRSNIYDHFKYREEKRQLLRELELLIIDEVSMVRCDLLDVIDRLLRIFGEKPSLPFGGKQVVLIGDPFQLPPVAKTNEWDLLSDFYPNPFFFSAKGFPQLNPVCLELQKIYRQTDMKFISLLNRVRNNTISKRDVELLNKKVMPKGFDFSAANYIFLGTHNRTIDQINENKLNQLEGERFEYKAKVEGKFPERDFPTYKKLPLKKNAQVMFIRNDSNEPKRYFNGKVGTVVSLKKEEIIVEFKNGKTVKVGKDKWEKVRYKWNKRSKSVYEEIEGTFEQFPLKHAWAITVHKSQGLTFERVYADLAEAFAPGQIYVALSRCTDMEGLKLVRPINRFKITTAKEVLHFAEQLNLDFEMPHELRMAKADEKLDAANEAYHHQAYHQALFLFLEAIKLNEALPVDDFIEKIANDLKEKAKD